MCVRASAEPQTTSKPSGQMAGEYVDDNEFSISKVSFGSILTPVGLGLLFWGFGAYFTLLPGADLSSIMLIYGFPISLLGFALNYAKVRAAAPRSLGHSTPRALLVLMGMEPQFRRTTNKAVVPANTAAILCSGLCARTAHVSSVHPSRLPARQCQPFLNPCPS